MKSTRWWMRRTSISQCSKLYFCRKILKFQPQRGRGLGHPWRPGCVRGGGQQQQSGREVKEEDNKMDVYVFKRFIMTILSLKVVMDGVMDKWIDNEVNRVEVVVDWVMDKKVENEVNKVVDEEDKRVSFGQNEDCSWKSTQLMSTHCQEEFKTLGIILLRMVVLPSATKKKMMSMMWETFFMA